MAERKTIYLNPTPVRMWHWLHAFCVITLILTGIQIRFPEYFGLFGSYKNAVRLHNTAGILVSITFFLWFFYYAIVAGTLAKLYLPRKEELQHGIWQQGIYYFSDYFRGKPNPHTPTPENKFDPLQKAGYLFIMLAVFPLQIVTGMALMYPHPIWGIIDMFGSLKTLFALHFLVGCLLCAYLIIHVYLASLATPPWSRFKAMWDGWYDVE